MRFFDRLSNGWALGKTSLQTLKEHPNLLLFPLVSGAALIVVTLSFFGGGFLLFGPDVSSATTEYSSENGISALAYVLGFLFYLVTYFVIVFFNVALVHCARTVLEGDTPDIGAGFRFAQSRMGAILGWAVLAATVGIILKAIQERTGTFGNIITGIIGLVWNVATFFVVPVIAYEDISPIEAVKRSSSIMKRTWGESIGANFSFGLFSFLGFLLIALPSGILAGLLIHPVVGILAGILAFILIQTAVSAAQIIFITAAYQHVNQHPTGPFDRDRLDRAFVGRHS